MIRIGIVGVGFMGMIFSVGIDVSDSVLLVEFANRLRRERGLC